MNIYINVARCMHGPIFVQLHQATPSSLKTTEFRNYQRSLFKALRPKTLCIHVQGWFGFSAIDLVIREVRSFIACSPCIEKNLVIRPSVIRVNRSTSICGTCIPKDDLCTNAVDLNYDTVKCFQ